MLSAVANPGFYDTMSYLVLSGGLIVSAVIGGIFCVIAALSIADAERGKWFAGLLTGIFGVIAVSSLVLGVGTLVDGSNGMDAYEDNVVAWADQEYGVDLRGVDIWKAQDDDVAVEHNGEQILVSLRGSGDGSLTLTLFSGGQEMPRR